MKTVLFILTLLGIQMMALAAGGGHGEAHDEHAIPASTIMYQAINLGILLIIIFFAIRKSVVAFFKLRAEQYHEEARKTAEAAQAAELALADIKGRIQNLQNTEQASIENAKKEALVLKNKIIQEAQIQSERIKSDAQLVVNAEINNAKREIRQEIINASIETAKNNMKKSSEAISKKLEKDFLDNISKTKQVNS